VDRITRMAASACQDPAYRAVLTELSFSFTTAIRRGCGEVGECR
jgi:hypothetical protein